MNKMYKRKDVNVRMNVMYNMCALGSSDFDKIFENGYASCSFELAKDI